MNKFIITYTDANENVISPLSNSLLFSSDNLTRDIYIKVENTTAEETYPRFYLTIPTSTPRYKSYIMNSSTDIINKIDNQTISIMLGEPEFADDQYQPLFFGEINSIAGTTILPNREKTYSLKIKLLNQNVTPFINAFNIEVV